MCTVKLRFLVIILPNESSVHCKIEIFTRHFSVWEQCALSKLKFLAIILLHESSVHCKIEGSTPHFSL